MFANIFIFSCFFFLVFGQPQSRAGSTRPMKPGDCPPLSDAGVCSMNCFADNHCTGTLKCCRTSCGGTFCVKPVTTRRSQQISKQGSCPQNPTGPWVCSSRCAFDTDCRGSKKCCRNRCGAMACIMPER